MKKVSDLELERLVNILINNIDNDNFRPDLIVEAGDSAHYTSSKLGEYFSVDAVKIEGGYRCNSENIFLSKFYSLLRKIKKNLYRVVGSGDNYFLDLSRRLVLEIYKRNYPLYLHDENDHNNRLFNQFDKNLSILIVDDNVFTGRTLECVTKFLMEKGFKKENIRSCALTAPYEYRPNYYSAEEIMSFPWNPIGI